MNHVVMGLLLLFLCLSTSAEQTEQGIGPKPEPRPSGQSSPKRLKRAESFFGIHFDFHARQDCTEIGKNTTPEMVQKIITAAHPDYIQIDCKGHPGFSSYPTKVGNPAPGFVGDPLRVWREVTARNGVALYMHYSGVWDAEAIRRHPEWSVINVDGSTNKNDTSFFSGYCEQLLIPQLRELGSVYGVDGVWVDGDCWAAAPDYGPAALQAFRTATGIEGVPRKPSAPHWFDFLQFNREAYRAYLRHYLTEVHQSNPEMQLCSNWAFSDHMPEPVSAPVDWISGDFSPEDSVNSARFSARYLAHQGKPWDLMAWGFTTQGERRNGTNLKSAVQLEREAAVVLAQGGGFESYYNQKRDGSVPETYLPVIGEVATFCRARQPFCQGATPVPQIALLYSTAAHYREMNSLFGRDLSRLSGTLEALVESQHVVDVVSEHHLTNRMSRYPLIIVGECNYLEPSYQRELVAYVQKGGSLLVMGPEAAALFHNELGTALGQESGPGSLYLASDGAFLETKGAARKVRLSGSARAVGELHTTADASSSATPAASVATLGSGRIAATYFSFSRSYLASPTPQMRTFLGSLVKQLFPKPLVEVSGSPNVDVCVDSLRGNLAIHLINNSGPHSDKAHPLIESIAPAGPIQLTVRAAKPAGVRLEPGGEDLPFDYRDGTIQVTVPNVGIHRIVLLH